MSNINIEIERQLRNENVDIIHFVDISMLDTKQNRGFPFAILIGIAINPHFLEMVCNTPYYTHTIDDEYAQTESRVGLIADKLTNSLISNGYKALSQSDNGLMTENAFDFETKTSALPHKTIALLSGIGYIGKNNLFITEEFGAAQCLGSVLTNAPLTVTKNNILLPKCNRCTICLDICPQKALKGVCWNTNVSRDEIVDVYNCITCLKCMACCPKSRAYMKRARIHHKIVKADIEDLQEILQLQYLAYQSEAALFGSCDIPPLKQTLDEVIEEYRKGIILKMVTEDGLIIGSIRAYGQEGTIYVGKLMVHPDYRQLGYGTRLLSEIEKYYPQKRYELFTSTRSTANIRLYQRMGYHEFDRKTINDELEFIYMEKTSI